MFDWDLVLNVIMGCALYNIFKSIGDLIYALIKYHMEQTEL